MRLADLKRVNSSRDVPDDFGYRNKIEFKALLYNGITNIEVLFTYPLS